MFEILIDKQIGNSWFEEGITADFVKDGLIKAGIDDIRITIDSPGGDVFDCISIYNVIRDFCRSHTNKITTYIRGLAASAASVIALAASDANKENRVVIESNSVFMIHNGLTMCAGNRHDLRACADRLEKIADRMMIDVYTRRTGLAENVIKAKMDAETWLCGQEIIDEGFADGFIEDAKPEEKTQKDVYITVAKNSFNRIKLAAQSNLHQRMNTGVKIKNLGDTKNKPNIKNMEDCKMTVEELKNNNPDVYAAVIADGANSERKRASRLLAMGEKCNCTDYALECIKNNSDPSDMNVIDAFMDKKVAASHIKAQMEDENSIPNVVPPKDSGQKDNEAIMAAFDKELGRNL